MSEVKEHSTFTDEPNGTVQTVPLAYHEMCMQRAETKDERNRRTFKQLIIGWAISVPLAIAIAVGIFAYMWLQYDYVSTTEYSGVYNLTDSEGNVISSDLTPADIIEIMEGFESGKSADNTSPGTK